MKKPPARSKPSPTAAYDQFEASALFCPRCREAVPVRKRLLLILPDGDKYEYLCSYCSFSLGTKMEFEERDIQLIS
jgi:hypothetical protein